MRILLQRVTSGKVTVEGKTVASIGHGLVVLLGIGNGDTEEHAQFLAEKVAQLRIFEDEDGKFNRSILDVSGEAIFVSSIYALRRHAQGTASVLLRRGAA